jgi:hypothetical protein
LAIVNSAAINMSVQVSFLYTNLQGHKVGLFLDFGYTSILIFIVVLLVYIPTNRVGVCIFYSVFLSAFIGCFHVFICYFYFFWELCVHLPIY